MDDFLLSRKMMLQIATPATDGHGRLHLRFEQAEVTR